MRIFSKVKQAARLPQEKKGCLRLCVSGYCSQPEFSFYFSGPGKEMLYVQGSLSTMGNARFRLWDCEMIQVGPSARGGGSRVEVALGRQKAGAKELDSCQLVGTLIHLGLEEGHGFHQI